jgi:hypothetical protein
MRHILTILFAFTFLSAFSQNYDYLQAYRRFTLANRAVKGISNDTAFMIGSADSLVTQYAIKGYLYNHYGPGNNTVFGDVHQQAVAKFNNSNQLEFVEPLVYGAFVSTDDELAAAKLVFVDQETIFNSWKRFSHGTNVLGLGNPHPSDTIPGTPSETNSWSYNPTTQTISSTFNSASFIGFVSPQKYSRYTHSLTIGASGTTDNDYIITVIAFMEDDNDMVKNNAYGLNPADFNWLINTTDQYIPNQHTISLVRGRTDQPNFPFATPIRYAIVYDLGKLSEQVLVNGESLVWNTANTYGSGANCDVKVVRAGDIIKTYTTDWNDAPGGKGVLGHELIYDLSSLLITNKFRGSAAYGYGALSQENASYSNVSINVNQNVIYDLRNGQKWVADNVGTYSLDTGSYYIDYGVRRWLFNPVTQKEFYVKADRTFDIISSSDTSLIAGDTTYNYYTNENTYLLQSDSAYLDIRDFYGKGDTVVPIRVTRFVQGGDSIIIVTDPASFDIPASTFLESVIIVPSSSASISIGTTSGGSDIAESATVTASETYVLNLTTNTIYFTGLPLGSTVYFILKRIT